MLLMRTGVTSESIKTNVHGQGTSDREVREIVQLLEALKPHRLFPLTTTASTVRSRHFSAALGSCSFRSHRTRTVTATPGGTSS